MKIGNREFQTKGHTYVMGILNVTRIRFTDLEERRKVTETGRLKHVEEMIAEGDGYCGYRRRIHQTGLYPVI